MKVRTRAYFEVAGQFFMIVGGISAALICLFGIGNMIVVGIGPLLEWFAANPAMAGLTGCVFVFVIGIVCMGIANK